MVPISTKMRPKTVDEFIGQEQFMYKGSLLYNAIKNGNFENGIFYGPSGTGKTTLARIIANNMDAYFVEINATNTGVKELKEIIEKAKLSAFGLEKKKTYLYVDEIHRWNKLQQDTLLQAIEEGTIKFIGSTTENPYFSINNAILSRVNNIFQFKEHTTSDIKKILKKALLDKDMGFGNLELKCSEETLGILAVASNGDARSGLEKLGYIVYNLNGEKEITKEIVLEATMQNKKGFHREEDKYNLLSAMQKSIRGSDPDASVFYLAQFIEGTGDIQLIGRRLLVIASEDIGMAYPSAITVVNSCVQAALMVGLPEARLNLSQAVIFLASSPKSNSVYLAIDSAISDVRNGKVGEIPNYLKDSHYFGAKELGIEGYKYPHDFGGYVKQKYLPDEVKGNYYKPTDNGQELAFKNFLKKLEK